MKLRLISVLLTLALLLVLLPAPANAAGTDAAELEKQIKATYQEALRRAGRWSFNGYCGTLVNWQTYLLGIDTTKYGCDGKNEYDLYANLGTTTGGYTVKTYPASRYDLRSALNAITRNGTVDAYNILVGFQKTNTRLGSIYGHAMLIHGILDGVVYFSECYSTSLGGKYWAEGTPISCSIDTFCDYYNRWTVFDGIAYFGLKTYADACKQYPASMYAMAKDATDVYKEPNDPGLHKALIIDELVAGELVKVSALLKAPGGGYWYQLDRDGVLQYVQADKLMHISDCYDDVKLADLRAPTVIRKGNGFVLRGSVVSESSRIRSVRVAVYGEDSEPVMEGELEVDGKAAALDDWRLDRYMTFRKLQAGDYRMVITAKAESYAFEDGAAKPQTRELTLWDSQLKVVTDWKQYATVCFDGNGGSPELMQTVVANGTSLPKLPGATRPGAVLTGWALDPEGTEPVTRETVFTGQVTLYAQWEQARTALSGGQHSGEHWDYYINGVCVTQSTEADRTVIADWKLPGGALMAAGTALRQATASAEPEKTVQAATDPTQYRDHK